MTSFDSQIENDLYQNMIDKFTGSKRVNLHFHVSDLVNICPRAVWYARKNGTNFRFKRAFPKQMVLAFSYGILIQRLLSQYSSYLISKWKCFDCGKTHYISYPDFKGLKCNPYNMKLEEYGLELTRGWFSLTGSVDAFIRVGNKVFIAEIKSMEAKEFDKLEEPLFDHLVQSCGYLWMHNNKFVVKDPAFDKYRVDKEEAYIIYFKKDFQKLGIKSFLIDRKVYGLDERIPQLLKDMTSKTIPERGCRTELSPNAKKCPFKEVCFGKSKKKQAKREGTPKKDS